MKEKRILNVGCGNDSFGTDFIDVYPLRPEVKKCDLDTEKFPYKDNLFDEVYSRSNLEHLTNPMNFFRESFRVLKPGGKITIITDNTGQHGWLGRVHLGNYEVEHKGFPEDRHHMLFTPTHLKNFFLKFGFVVKEIKYYDGSNDMRLWVLSHLNKRFSPHLIAIGRKSTHRKDRSGG